MNNTMTRRIFRSTLLVGVVVLLAALLAEGSLPPGAAVPVWVGLDTGGERTYNAE